ncbi:MAG: PKD domain-containing protein, partial [Melioribacteraceae bacterium]|nr:PKD domain-containing protein [Melioribacteraceae bacterium]
MKLITTLILIFSISIFAQDRINYITYGSDASINEGDDDHHQILIIKVPANRITPIYVKIFDADIGGDFDMPFGPWNTTTKFTLLGGEGAVPETLKAAFPDSASMHSGEVIESVTFGEDINANADWITLANVMPFLGDSSDGYFEFKLLVEGNNGNDANVYDVLVSDSEFDNHQSESVELFAYEVTIRLTQFDNYASVRFMTPLNQSSIEVNHFDAGTSDMSFETPFRTFKMTSRSGQGNWVSQKIALEDVEQNTLSEIHFGQGGESPNDATFYITDANLKALPILLPIIDGKSNKRPVISKTVNKLSDCFSVVFDASGSMDPDGDQLKYLWDFGDGTEESGARVVHKYQLRTDYPVTLLVFDNSNQVANSSFEKFIVNINQPPKAEFNFPSVVAPNQKINFDANSSTDQDGDIILYTWTFGDGVVKNGKVISHSFAKTGTYSVQLVVTDDSDSPCNSTSITKAIKVNETPLARAGDDLTVAAGDNVKFDAAKSIDPDGEISSYTWDFGNGLIKNGLSVNHTFSEPGQYPVTLKISDDASVENSYSEDLLIVNVNYPPKADAGADKNVAKGELILFSGQGSSDQDGQIIKYEWDFGDGEKGVGANVSHVYSEAGRYSVKLTVTDNSGTTSASTSDDLLVNVNSAPTANAGSDIVVTRGTVQFDGSGSTDSEGGNLSYLWDFGDGNTSNEKSPSHLYNNSGEYLVKLIVTDNSGTKNNRSTDQLKVIVNQKPIADAGPDRTVVPNQKVQFDGSNSFDPDGEIVKYVWDFGDGNTAEGKIVEHLYENSGSYSVTLRVEDNTGHESAYDFDESALVVNKAPIADAGLDIVTYPGKEVLLTGVNSKDEDGSIVSYSWTISGFNETHNQRDVKRSFEKSGVYKATLTVKDNSGLSNSISTDFVLIRVNETPVADAGENIKSCNSIITFDASQSVDADGDALNYIWDFGDGSPTENGVKVIHDFVNGGNFPVTLTVDDGLGLPNSTSTSTITVSINQPPLADAGADRIICAGNVAIFNGSASSDPEEGVLVYYWDFGDGTTAEGINTTKSYSAGGIYEVTLKIEDDSGLPCNSDVDRLVVKVVEAPVANAGQDITVCANSEVKFDGSKSTDFDGVVNSYFWNFGDGTTGGGASPTHIFSQSGKYKVTLTITGDVTEGCDNSDTDELIVNVIAAPEAKFTSVDKAPVNTQVFFDASLSSVEGSEIV